VADEEQQAPAIGAGRINGCRCYSTKPSAESSSSRLTDAASDLAEGLRVLVGDPTLRRKLGEGARLRSEQFYSCEHYRERVLAFYSKVPVIGGNGGC